VDGAALVSAIHCSPAPVLVEFCAGSVATDLESLGPALAGEAVVLRVDTRVEPAAAQAYRVGAGGAVVLFSRGSELERSGAAGDLDPSQWRLRVQAAVAAAG
jgi:hypothetical protein